MFRIEYTYEGYTEHEDRENYIDISWNKIFITLAEIIRDGFMAEDDAKEKFEWSLIDYVNDGYDTLQISDKIFNTIKYQLEAIELLKITTTSGLEILSLTEKGKMILRDSIIIKRE